MSAMKYVNNYRKYTRTVAFRLSLITQKVLHRRPLIAVTRWSGIGDIVSSFPAVEALRKKYPGAYIVYGTAIDFAPLVQTNANVDAVIPLEWQGRLPIYRRSDYDLAFEPVMQDEKPTEAPNIHLVDHFGRELGVELRDRQPRVVVSAALHQKAKEIYDKTCRGEGPVVAIHIGPTWAVRSWPLENWETLTKRLREEYKATVVQVGADAHAPNEKRLSARVPGAVDLVGQFSLAETAAFIELCDEFIGIDSGLLHVAGAVNTKCVGIFGPVDPDLRMPPTTPSTSVRSSVPCTGCHHKLPVLHWKSGCPHAIACMRSITAEQVFREATALLEDSAPQVTAAR